MKATHKMGGHFKSIKEARVVHLNKLSAVSTQAFRLCQQAPQQSTVKRQEHAAILEAVQAQALELSMQLSNFDTSVAQCIDCVTSTGGNGSNDESGKDKQVHHIITSAKRRICREIYRLKLALPALSLRHEIEKNILSNQFVVIQGATGSG